jgi:uncharacterized membrane protein HdeD (DUF308 family)
MIGLRKRDWTNILVQCLIIAVGVYFVAQRQQALVQLTTLLAAAIIGSGIWGVVLCFINQRRADSSALLPPVLMAVFGLVLFLFRREATGIVPFLVGLWALIMGAVKVVVTVQYYFSQEPGWWLQIPQAVLRLVLGVLILSGALNLNAIFALLMGIYLIAFGAFNIVEYLTVIFLGKRRG